MNYDLVEQTFNDIYNHIPAEAMVLGGGAPRDAILGGKIKDYDFYITVDSRNLTNFEYLKLGTTLRNKFGMFNNLDQYANLNGKNPVHAVWTNKERDVQFIILKDMRPDSYIHQYFDIGICETYIDADGNVWVGDNFVEDKERSEIKLRPKLHHSYHTIGKAIAEHLPRVAKKYPHYKPVIVPEVQPVNLFYKWSQL